LDGVAITDHDTVQGALKLVNNREIIIIPGMEVSTLQGHVLAFNVTEPVPSNLSVLETIEKIHELGGIAVAAHPSVMLKGLRIRMYKDLNFDAVEVINAAAFPFFLSTRLNQRMAVNLNLPQTGGSDAHYAPEIGLAYTLIDASPEMGEIAEAIRKGATVPFGKAVSWRMRLEKEVLSLKRKLQ
jgi:predicted metal-dependent phosphoesterase TrpH